MDNVHDRNDQPARRSTREEVRVGGQTGSAVAEAEEPGLFLQIGVLIRKIS